MGSSSLYTTETTFIREYLNFNYSHCYSVKKDRSMPTTPYKITMVSNLDAYQQEIISIRRTFQNKKQLANKTSTSVGINRRVKVKDLKTATVCLTHIKFMGKDSEDLRSINVKTIFRSSLTLRRNIYRVKPNMTKNCAAKNTTMKVPLP